MPDAAPGFRCPLCGGMTAELIAELPHPLVRCVTCDLLRLHPSPDDATLATAYASDYAPHSRVGISGRAKGWLERRSVRQLRRYLAPPQRVLDVGCATGELLMAVRVAGNRNVVGVELSQDAAKMARSRGLDVHSGTLEDAAFPDEHFETVIASHTLEHVPDPVVTLREMHRILSPGGAVILWLPNVESVEARMLGTRWIGYDPPRHLTTFGVSTLTRALDTTGFRVVEIRHEAVGLEWAWGFRSWLGERRPGIERVAARLHPMLIIAATPLAMIGAATGQSGRIRVVAVKPMS